MHLFFVGTFPWVARDDGTSLLKFSELKKQKPSGPLRSRARLQGSEDLEGLEVDQKIVDFQVPWLSVKMGPDGWMEPGVWWVQWLGDTV